LLDYFEKQHEQIEGNSQLTPVQRFLNSQDQMEHLKRNLAVLERSGDSKRTKGGSFLVELVAGFKDICTFLDRGSAEKVIEIEESEAVGDADNWTTIGTETITVDDAEAWTNTGILRAGLRKTICKVINHSKGGYCLYIDADEKFHLKVGELAIVKQSGMSDWQLVVIIWVSGSKKRMDFGLKILDGSISKGTLSPIYAKNTDISFDCLFLNSESDNGDEIRIITSSPDFHQGDRLLLNVKGNEYQVSVNNINAETKGYDEYLCEQSNSQDAMIENTQPQTKLEMDFESIWDDL
jgi:hypothetical protein